MPVAADGGEAYSHSIRFIPDGNGLKPRFENPYSQASKVEGEHRSELSLVGGLSRDHGVLTVPVRLPRYLMPEWSQAQWAEFIDGEMGFFHNFVDEAVVQCLSLAVVDDKDRRAEVLRTANEVVIDFRGDLPNKYLPMMLGGYKVGVYRSGNNWPIWLSIQPTYDLAVKEAEKIRDEAGLPKKAIVSTGALANFLKSKLNLTPILSNASSEFSIRSLITPAVIVAAVLLYWIMR